MAKKAKALLAADLEADFYSTSFYDSFTQKTYSKEDKARYQVGAHLDKSNNRQHYCITPKHDSWKEMDVFIADNGFTPKEAMYIRQGLGYQMTIKESYEFYLDRQKPEHPERALLRRTL